VKFSGELGRLAGGPVGFAGGIETRTESMNDVPDPIAQQGGLIGTGSSRTQGDRRASAIYAEFNLPVVKSLELQLAGRSDSYSDFGSAFSPKVGAKWTVSPQVAVRASVAKGFRAPTLVENSNSASLGFASVADPLRNNAATIIGVLNTGSKGLKAETSKSTSIGIVMEPTPNLSFSADIYSIEQRDLVALNGESYIVRNPTLFPGAVVRDPATNQILVVYDNYTNQAKVETKGVDLDVRAKLGATSWGKFAARAGITYVGEWNFTVRNGVDPVNYANRNDGPYGALPLYKVRASLDWVAPAFAVTVSANQTGGYDQRNTTAAAAEKRVSDMTTWDVYAAYTGIKNAKLGLSITNLFNRNPPWDIATGLGISNAQYDLRGRYLRAFAEYKF
jgi:iron complex outermembrane recepter protein